MTLRLECYVQPCAARTELAGIHDGLPKVRVATRPIDGDANAALIAFVARRLQVPPRGVRLIRGAKGRRKLLEIDGTSAAATEAAFGVRATEA